MTTDANVTKLSRVVIAVPGDTLTSLARDHYNDESFADDLARVNGMAVSAILVAGTKVKIPHKAALRREKQLQLGTTLAPIDAPMLAPVISEAQRPWWLKPQVWIAAGIGGAILWTIWRMRRRA